MSDLSKEMENERKAHGDEERKQAAMYGRMLEYRRERFALAEKQLFFMSDQNLADTLFVQDNVLTWLSKAKDGSEQKKVLDEMAKSLIRMNAYTITVESSAKAAVTEQLRDSEIVSRLESDIRKKDLRIMQLELEPEKLKKEIEKLKEQSKF